MAADEAFETIRRCVLDVLPELGPEQIHRDISLRDLGADSLDRMDIVVSAMEQLGVRLPPEELGTLPDIGALAELLSSRQLPEATR